MLASVETIEKARNTPEVYAQSMRCIRALGGVALQGAEFSMNPESQGVINAAWNDFYGAVEENLATDPEFGESLIFDKFTPRKYVDGHVRDEQGKPVVNMVRAGHEASMIAARKDKRILTQAERDEGDVFLAKQVDSLEVGEMCAAMSFDPREQIEEDAAFWEDKMHYRKGMGVLQVYYRTAENEVITGVYAIKKSDRKAMSHIFAKEGMVVPPDTSYNQWTKHVLKKKLGLQEAKEFGASVRSHHREYIGARHKEYSVTEFMHEHQEVVREYFDTYVVELAKSVYTQQNSRVLQKLSTGLSGLSSLSSDTRRELIRIANSSKFSDQNGRFLESMIRYALVEELRESMKDFMGKTQTSNESNNGAVYMPDYALTRETFFVNYAAHQMQMMQRLVFNVDKGTSAGRDYGGCSGGGPASSKDIIGHSDGIPDHQDVFGGALRGDDKESASDFDDLGDRNFKCTKGHDNYRRVRNVPEKVCRVCKEDVSCKPVEEKPKAEKSKVVSIFRKREGARELKAP